MKNNTSKWFPKTVSEGKKIRLFCFPFAGGHSHTYRLWENYLPDFVDVCPAHLPGRTNRISEPGFSELSKLADSLTGEIIPYLDIPFAFFGHSMGAIVSFELAHRLRERNKSPLHLFVSGARAPQIPARTPDLHDLPDNEFKAELLKLNGTSSEILNNTELFEFLLPTLRTDFELVEKYRFEQEICLNCPITAFGGDRDDEVYPDELESWSAQTCKSFKYKIFSGDHFYFDSNPEELLNFITKDLSSYV